MRVIPSAGPYRVASYTPNQGVVLTRNPNYHGSRPHRLARIELAVGIPGPARHRPGRGRHRRLRDERRGRQHQRRHGSTLATARDSPAAKSGHQQYFVNPQPAARLLRAEHPPAAVRRRANPPSRQLRDRPRRAGPARRRLLRHCPTDPTDHYLPPGIPGYVDGHIYPLIPDLTKARRLAKGHAGATAVLYTCDRPPCDRAGTDHQDRSRRDRPSGRGQGLPGPTPVRQGRDAGRAVRHRLRRLAADYPDPQGVLDSLLENGSNLPPLDDPSYRAKLRAAARLSGPERYLGLRPARPGSRPQRRPTRRVRATYPATSCSPRGWAARPTGFTASTSQRCASRDPPTEGQRRGSPQSQPPLEHENPAAAARRPADEEGDAVLSRGPALLSGYARQRAPGVRTSSSAQAQRSPPRRRAGARNRPTGGVRTEAAAAETSTASERTLTAALTNAEQSDRLSPRQAELLLTVSGRPKQQP